MKKPFLKLIFFAGSFFFLSAIGCGPKKPAENKLTADTSMKDSAPSSDPHTQPIDTVY